MQDVGDILTEDFAVTLYQVLDRYLTVNRVANIPLEKLPEIFESYTQRPFPVPWQLLRNGAMDHLITLSVPATGLTVVDAVRLLDPSPAGICMLHRLKLEQLRKGRSTIQVRSPAGNVEMQRQVQLLLRGLHRALQLRPLPAGLPPQELEDCMCIAFFDVWKIPFLYTNIGYESALSFVSAFPAVFALVTDAQRIPRLVALDEPNFTVGSLKYSVATKSIQPESSHVVGPTLSVEQAKQIDSLRSTIALIKCELQESGHDLDKTQRLQSRLVQREIQLRDYLQQLQT